MKSRSTSEISGGLQLLRVNRENRSSESSIPLERICKFFTRRCQVLASQLWIHFLIFIHTRTPETGEKQWVSFPFFQILFSLSKTLFIIFFNGFLSLSPPLNHKASFRLDIRTPLALVLDSIPIFRSSDEVSNWPSRSNLLGLSSIVYIVEVGTC